MNTREISRIAVPLVIGAAILVSFRFQKPRPPEQLQGGAPPAPPAAQVQAAYRGALAPGAPGHDLGVRSAPVTVLEFADFGCPYCARFASAVYPQLAAEFVRTGIVRWRSVPFVLGIFQGGDGAARAAECAAEQGEARFAAMSDRLYAAQDAWTGASDQLPVFRSLAAAAGLDPARFAACYASQAPRDRVQAANDLADRMGVNATPTFFINGQRIEGALPLQEFQQVIMDALRHSGGAAPPQGGGGGR